MFALLNFLLPGSDEGYKVADGKYEGVTNNHKPRQAIQPCHGQSCSFLDVRACGDLQQSVLDRRCMRPHSQRTRERLCRCLAYAVAEQ